MKIPFVKSRFTKVIQPNRFDFTPRYYNPAKEELEQRVKEIKAENGISDPLKSEADVDKEMELRARFKNRVEQSRNTKGVMSSSYRFLIILVSILLLGYFLFTNLDGILKTLLK